jgi:hypothetical protein
MAPSSPAPGRNEPCPCGSGRKYKYCCLAARGDEDAARLRIRRAEARVVDALLKYLAGRWGQPFFDAAWEDFFLWDDVPQNMAETPEFETMFLPWLTTLYVADPHAEDFDPQWPAEPVALHWLEDELPEVDAYDRRWIDAACRSPLSAFVVEDVAPGRSMDLRDILTGRRFHVLEQGASQTLERHDVSFSRVVTVDDVSVMFGATPFVINARWHTKIIDWRESTKGGGLMTRSDLEDFDIEIRELYLDIAAQVLNPVPPRLANTDGDPLALTTLTFAVDGTVEEVAARLAPLARLPHEDVPAEMLDENERDAEGALTSAVLSWKKSGNKKHKNWSNTILGRFQLTPGRLVAEVNSEKRAKRCVRELRKLLGPGLTLLKTEVVDAQDLMTRASSRAGADADSEPPPDLQTPELLAMEEELFRQHLEAWVDEKIPALGNRTPRVVARTPLGRERLAALLATFEGEQVARLPNGRAMLDELRARLGIEDRRIPGSRLQ